MPAMARSAACPLAALISLVGANAALARQAQSEPRPQIGTQVQEIIVTGSHVPRSAVVVDSPMVIVERATIQSVGSPTLETALDQLPQITTSASASSNFSARGGQASVDLRGLGQQRTLVLADGIRLQPSLPNGSVDLNILPPILLDAVEIISGGASAVYGSDAVTGVVNLKLRPSFKGIELEAQYGATGRGDGGIRDIGGLIGTDFKDGKGNAYLGFDYAHRDPVNYTDRSYLTNQALSTRLPQGVLNVNAANLPSQAFLSGYFADPAHGGVAAGTVKGSSPLIAFNNDGSIFVQAGPSGPINYRGNLENNLLIYNNELYDAAANFFLAQFPLTRYAGFGRFDYQVASDIKLYGQILITHYTARTQGPPAVAGSSTGIALSIPTTNPFISSDLAALLASRPNPNAPFTIATQVAPLGDRGERDEYTVYQAVLGASGGLGFRDMTWNVYGAYGRTDYHATELNFPSASAMNTLLSAADGGMSKCAGGYDPFGLHPLSASCVTYINRNPQQRTVQDQGVVEATLQGTLFQLPAGPLKFAGGLDYRRDSYSFQPDSEISSGDLENYLPVKASAGSSDVRELYGEFLAPVLRDQPLIDELNLDLAYRYSDYDSAGGVSTYSAQVGWKLVRSFRLRGGYARATRAPSVGELYAAEQISAAPLGTALPTAVGVGDPCDIHSAYRAPGNSDAAKVLALCLTQGVPASVISNYTNNNPQTNFTTAGNTALRPERADTYTLGAVWQPSFENPLFSRMSLSVDYYSMVLDGAIGTVTSVTALQRCFNADGSNPAYSNSNYYCGLVTRQNSTGLISNVINPQLNLGAFKTDGVDIESDWTFGLNALGLSDKFGRLTLRANANYLNSFKIQTLSGGPFRDYAGTIGNTQIDPYADAHPRWKATSSVTYSVGPADLSLKWRYLGPMSNAANVGTNGALKPVQAISYFDLSAVWRVTPKTRLRAGVVNLADQAPPTVNPSIVGSLLTDLNTYDLLGRRFYLALNTRF